MKRIAILSLIGATAQLAGCGPLPSDADAYRAAVPTQKQLRVDVPGAVAQQAGKLTQALGTERAMLYSLTRGVSAEANGGVWVLLHTIESVVNLPPTSVEANTAVWGPHTPPLELVTWKLTVTRERPDQYSYVLAARHKKSEGPFLTVVEGVSNKGASPIFSGYHGELTAHADTMHELDPTEHEATGKIKAIYDTTGVERSLTLELENFSEDGNPPADATYSYRDREDTSGEFSFGAEADLDENGSAMEQAKVVSAWDGTGAGRGEAKVVGGDLDSAVALEITECWNDTFERVYYQDSLGLLPPVGSADACAIAPITD